MVRGRRSSSRFTPSLPEKPGLSPTLPGPLPSPMRTPLQPLFRLESPETPRSPWVQVCMAGAGPQCRLKHPGSGLQPSSASQLKEKTPEGGGGAGRPGCAAAEGPSCSIWKKRALRGLCWALSAHSCPGQGWAQGPLSVPAGSGGTTCSPKASWGAVFLVPSWTCPSLGRWGRGWGQRQLATGPAAGSSAAATPGSP